MLHQNILLQETKLCKWTLQQVDSKCQGHLIALIDNLRDFVALDYRINSSICLFIDVNLLSWLDGFSHFYIIPKTFSSILHLLDHYCMFFVNRDLMSKLQKTLCFVVSRSPVCFGSVLWIFIVIYIYYKFYKRLVIFLKGKSIYFGVRWFWWCVWWFLANKSACWKVLLLYILLKVLLQHILASILAHLEVFSKG